MADKSVAAIPSQRPSVPRSLFVVCFALACINAAFFPAGLSSGIWIWGADGLGIPTDFVNVWAAGKLALQGHPALAWDWDVQRQLELDLLKQDFPGYFAWHYPPPFLFVAAFLAQFPYITGFAGWVYASFVPFALAMRAIVGRGFGVLLAAGFPALFSNALVGQNGCLTAALVGGTLYWLPVRPVLAGICLGLLTYKPQYGLLFPIVLIATQRWTAVVSATVTALVLAAASLVAFGLDSWQAFFHWLPMFSQAFLTEGKATWWKLQSLFSLVRYFGGSEALGWTFQWVLTAAVAVVLVTLWRSRLRYSLKAAALAIGLLLTTPYLFMYDMMVQAIAVAWLVRLGLHDGFRRYELPAFGCIAALQIAFMLTGIPLGLAANLMVGGLVLARAGSWWRRQPVSSQTALAAA
ncbi:glycosyltransferase family 87 protein [Bradyrhizobium sp. SRS-191]|uniref:glycosyltransferase family 87 protein n=1 Tax=Bradyrhizobium sp. SRS-191 TaxID=2962606 RepID=UPI00211DC4F4|nr:glycosyltransferase family 87 protein [Bradyrhizobium sp. SRS-191]